MLYLCAITSHHIDDPLSELHRYAHRFGDALLIALTYGTLVHHDTDVMYGEAVESHPWRQLAHLTINVSVEEATSSHLLEKLTVVSLAIDHDGSQDVDPLVSVLLHNMLHDLLLGVAHHLLAREVRIGSADTCIEDT